MCSRSTIINRYTMAFQLNEALEAVHAALGDEDADPANWVSLAAVLGHLCLAWHRKRLGPDEVTKESQEEYELKSDSVPNWGGRFRLVGFAASHPAIALQLSRHEIDRDTVGTYLRAAEAALQSLLGKIESGELDACDIAPLANEFELVLYNLCLAWHLRYLSSEEISATDPTAIKELGSWLPPWQCKLRLVSPDEELEKAAERSWGGRKGDRRA